MGATIAALDLGRLGARPGDHHVHHRHADLRLLLARGGDEGDRPEAEGDAMIRSGVSLLSRKAWATRPANPTRIVSAPPRESPARRRPAHADRRAVHEAGGLEDDALARLDARRGSRRCRRRARRAATQRRRALPSLDHEQAGEAAALEDRRGGDAEARVGGRTPGTRSRAKRPARRPGADGQVRLHLEPVGGRVAGRGDRGDRRRRAGAGWPSHEGLDLRARPQGRGDLGLHGGAQLEAALALDLDQRHPGVHDVAEVHAAARPRGPRTGARSTA